MLSHHDDPLLPFPVGGGIKPIKYVDRVDRRDWTRIKNARILTVRLLRPVKLRQPTRKVRDATWRRMFCAGVFLLLVPSSAAFAAVHGSYTVSFEGTSTLHSFSGTLPPITFEARPTPDPASGKETWSADLEAPVAAMRTENDRRDRNMREMLDASAFPYVKASVRKIDPDTLRGSEKPEGEARRPFTFELTIRDVTHPLVGIVSNWREDPDRASFDLDFDVSLAQFGLEAPTTFLFIRVGDRVAVHVAVSIRRK